MSVLLRDLSMLWPRHQSASPSQAQTVYLIHPGQDTQPCTKAKLKQEGKLVPIYCAILFVYVGFSFDRQTDRMH